MKTLIQQLEQTAKDKKQKLKAAIFDWLIQFNNVLTHSVTFTINPTIFDAIDRHGKATKLLTKKQKIDMIKKNFDFFTQRLNVAVYGNASRRYDKTLLIIPVIEGQYQDGRLHFHCAIGVPTDRLEGIEQKILHAWRATPLAGYMNQVNQYENRGWLSYISKQAVYLNRESIAWEQVKVPKKILTHC